MSAKHIHASHDPNGPLSSPDEIWYFPYIKVLSAFACHQVNNICCSIWGALRWKTTWSGVLRPQRDPGNSGLLAQVKLSDQSWALLTENSQKSNSWALLMVLLSITETSFLGAICLKTSIFFIFFFITLIFLKFNWGVSFLFLDSPIPSVNFLALIVTIGKTVQKFKQTFPAPFFFLIVGGEGSSVF